MSSESGGEQRRVRVEKLERLRAFGIHPYPERFERTHTLAEMRALPEGQDHVKVCGRVVMMRVMGKLTFATILDHSGRGQISVQQDAVGQEFYSQVWKKLVDIGDFIGITGKTMVTKTGEPTVAAESVVFLGKTLRPLPEKWHGLSDQETCYRQRYLDMIMNQETMDRFRLRSRVVRSIRHVLETHAFEEVETPVLQTKASGATARPFTSHHNALDMPVSLRIAPETWLKRLIVGGMDRVYEFARCFRNEGMDPSHLQDFTMLEFYAAWWNYEDNMRFTEHLLQTVIQDVLGTMTVELKGKMIDFSGTWPRVSFRDLILKDAGIDIRVDDTAQKLRSRMQERNIHLEGVPVQKLGFGNLVDQLYKKVSRPHLDGPVFLVDHPIELSPLARRNDRDPTLTDRFQLVVRSWEIVNAYSELVDPVDQRQRLETQAALKEAGDDEAMELDEEYLLAMEYGMPPISGFGMGIDRLVCLLTNQDNLRDVVLFPLMKPLPSDTPPLTS
ncbi:MAG TPA: lysine--tRNA ligase [Planctomycetota bacterium]|nr:lysine--tRNA ligase [Planctomycetota bacterium]